MKKTDIEKCLGLAVSGNELFDLSVPVWRNYMTRRSERHLPESSHGDTKSFDDICGTIATVRMHSGPVDGLAIIRGAYPHIIGALLRLQSSYNITYVPFGEIRLSPEFPEPRETITPARVAVQMQRALGVVRHFGYQDLETARASLERKPDDDKPNLVVIACNETGLHELYTNQRLSLYPLLAPIIDAMEEKPGFVSYISEGLHVGTVEKQVYSSQPHSYPRTAFLQGIYHSGIPVNLGAFGWDETPQEMKTDPLQESFSDSSVYMTYYRHIFPEPEVKHLRRHTETVTSPKSEP